MLSKLPLLDATLTLVSSSLCPRNGILCLPQRMIAFVMTFKIWKFLSFVYFAIADICMVVLFQDYLQLA